MKLIAVIPDKQHTIRNPGIIWMDFGLHRSDNIEIE